MIDCRDMIVVRNPLGGWFGYVVNRRKGTNAFDSACIGLYVSKDLTHWESKGPCFTPQRHNVIEVPDVFKLGDRWYLTGQVGNGYGQANRWSDPNIYMATIVAVANKPEGLLKRSLDDFIVSGSDTHCGPMCRTIERNGERLALFSHFGGCNRLSMAMKLVETHPAGLRRSIGRATTMHSGLRSRLRTWNFMPATGRLRR